MQFERWARTNGLPTKPLERTGFAGRSAPDRSTAQGEEG